MKHLLLSLLLLFFSIAANAQQSYEVSPVASFDFGSPLFINRAQGVLNPFNGTATGTSSMESYGLGVQLKLPVFLFRPLGLVGRMEGVYSTGRFAFDTAGYIVSGSEAKLLLEAGPTLALTPITIAAGPWVSQSIVRSITETNVTPSNNGSSLTHAGIFAGVEWNIPSFPIWPELNSHLDLTQLSAAGSNAWSIGISLTYSPIPHASAPTIARVDTLPPVKTEPLNVPIPQSSSLTVAFLVNGTTATDRPPLDRVELRIKEYTMVDSSNTAPKVTGWIEESYHLPHLSVLCENGSGADGRLVILNDGVPMIDRRVLADSNAPDTKPIVIDLDEDSSWQQALAQIKSTKTNQLVAEFEAGERVSRDTLLLPPVDSTTASTTTTKHEFRFKFSDDFTRVSGGREALGLLLDKMKSLLGEAPSITIVESAEQTRSQTELLHQIETALGGAWSRATRRESSNFAHYVTVVLEY